MPLNSRLLKSSLNVAVSLLLLAAQAAQAQSAFDLVQLMQTLSRVKSGQATFTETRSVAMLERPLEFSGRLSFEAPDTFVRETLKPRPERLALAGTQLTMSMGSRSKVVPVDSVPEASVIIEAIRGTLTGNREALEKNFSAVVSGNAQRWSLELVPREPRLREQISLVQIKGQQSDLREMAVTLADGDRSVMLIEPMSTTSKAAN